MRAACLLLALLGALAGVAARAAPPGRIVAVDVGHFAAEPGATSARGRPELEFNRDLARVLAEALAEQSLQPLVIGADGGMARLTDRTAAGRAAALLLSVHHDSVQPHYLETWVHDGAAQRYSDRYAGFSLFVSRRNPQRAASEACASRIGAALRAAGFAPSLYHAEPIPGESKPFADRTNGVHYYDNLVVLHTASSPAVLIEAGVIVNRDEEARMRDAATRQRIAAAVAAGAAECLR